MNPALAFHFVVPDPAAFSSGGNLYNARLMEALEGLRVEVRRWNWEDFAGGVPVSGGDCFLFDSLYLEALAASPLPPRSYLLAHLLPGMMGETSTAEAKALRRVEGVVVTGAWARNYIAARLSPEQRCLLLPPAPLLKAEGRVSKASQPTALAVAHLLPGKGIREWLEALAQQLKGRPLARGRVRIVGSLERDPAYAAACRQLGRQTPALNQLVRFEGACPPERLGAFYGAAHFFVSPSRFESFGMALQEAVGFGLPILALRGGNVAAHVREGRNGRLFDDWGALAEATLDWLEDLRRTATFRQAAQALRPIGSPSWTDLARRLMGALDGGRF